MLFRQSISLDDSCYHHSGCLDGNVVEFLKQDSSFGDIRELLEQQFERLSDQEKEIMYWLVINREPVSLFGIAIGHCITSTTAKILSTGVSVTA